MQQSINKDDIDNQLETLIMKVFLSKKNSIHRNYFLNAIKDLKPQYCTVKTGWRAGKYISVACKFKKMVKAMFLQK